MTSAELQKQDWWKINGYLQIGLAVYFILRNLMASPNNTVILASFIVGGLNALVGLALLKHSKLVFWIFFVLGLLGLVGSLGTLSSTLNGSPILLVGLAITVVQLACMFMLFHQIRNEKKLAPKKKK